MMICSSLSQQASFFKVKISSYIGVKCLFWWGDRCKCVSELWRVRARFIIALAPLTQCRRF
jgi:hypothetical protein